MCLISVRLNSAVLAGLAGLEGWARDLGSTGVLRGVTAPESVGSAVCSAARIRSRPGARSTRGPRTTGLLDANYRHAPARGRTMQSPVKGQLVLHIPRSSSHQTWHLPSSDEDHRTRSPRSDSYGHSRADGFPRRFGSNPVTCRTATARSSTWCSAEGRVLQPPTRRVPARWLRSSGRDANRPAQRSCHSI